VAVYIREEAAIQPRGKMMKTFLLLGVSIVVIAAALPSLLAKIVLSAFVLLATLIEAARCARKNPKKSL
jgi:hypothetical protein